MGLADCAVLLKPADWEVYGGHTKRQLSSFVKEQFGRAPIFDDSNHFRGFLHRLDVPSSGLILVTKTYEAHYNLQVQLHSGQLKRHYLVLSHGRFPHAQASLNANLIWHGDSPTFAGGRGRTARTTVDLQSHAWSDRMLGHAFSLLHVRIETGRKHQIRSHLAHVGHPVVGDGAYASCETFSADRALTLRHWLHRHCMIFNIAGKQCKVQTDLPEDLSSSLSGLKTVPPKSRDMTGAIMLPHFSMTDRLTVLPPWSPAFRGSCSWASL